MTVRANKPAFNFREKLKELERPIGLKGHELMGAETAQDVRDFISAGRKNMIINGDMNISQRNTTFSNPTSTANGYYTLDRFAFQASNTNYTVTRDTSAPAGFSKSLKVTMGTATTLDYMRLCSTIEGYNFRSAKFGTDEAEHLTLSFWVKSSLTGIFAIGFRNGTDLVTNISHSFVTTYEIKNANTWEYKTVSISPEINGTWSIDSNLGIVIMWDLGDSAARCQSITSAVNSTWQTADAYFPVGFDETIKLAGTSSATWQITGIQLEVGRNATDFEYRSFGEELALCQRYYYEYPKGNTYNIIANGFANTSSNAIFHFQFPVPMRSTPSTSGISGSWHVIDGTSHNVSSFSAITDATELTGRVDATTSGLTVGRGCMLRNNNDATATFGFSAEL